MTVTDRYLGTGSLPSPDLRALTGAVPEHLPGRLTICLWDFSWYTRAGEGEPYADLDTVCAETVARGYNTIRICAAPLLLFGGLGLDTLATDLPIEGLGAAPDGGYYGRRTRWYDTPGGYRLDLRARFFELFAAAQRHGLLVILASWEYQQSPSFAGDRAWHDALASVPLAERYDALATATDRMLSELEAAGHGERVAFTEIHNEVDFSVLPALADGGEAAVQRIRDAHPGQLVTASYGKPPHLDMESVSPSLDVAQFHVYSYGVLDELQKLIDIRSEGTAGFPNPLMRSLLRDDAPSLEEYGRPAAWKLDATVITDQMIYGYDWVDGDRWDAWLHEHYPPFEAVMLREIESRTIAVSAWARHRGIPTVIGEGWVGYTPRDAHFEDDPTGCSLAEHGIETALEHGVWGVVLCSNSAPHHPAWSDVDWQAAVNARVLAAPQ